MTNRHVLLSLILMLGLVSFSVPQLHSSHGTIPVGTELDVRLQNALSSDHSKVEDRFEATTMVNLTNKEGTVLVPAGSVVRGFVSDVDDAGRLDRKGRISLKFDTLVVGGRSYAINATPSESVESEGIKAETDRIGLGAGVGAIIGGILDGFEGALKGGLIGAGGVIVATEGKDVDLPAGTVLRLRFDSPVDLAG